MINTIRGNRNERQVSKEIPLLTLCNAPYLLTCDDGIHSNRVNLCSNKSIKNIKIFLKYFCVHEEALKQAIKSFWTDLANKFDKNRN